MTVTTSPLVAAYLADLDRALAGADPADRLEIVDAVREHIDAAIGELGAAPSQAQIAGVLRRLGTADEVAAAWSESAGADRRTAPTGASWSAPGWTRPAPAPAPATGLPTWATVLLVLLGVAVLGPLVLAVLVPLFLMPARVSMPAWLGGLTLAFVLLAAVGCLVVAWRSTRHRVGWLVAGVVALALLVPVGLGTLGWTTESGSSGGVVEQGVPVPAPTPRP